MPLLRFPEWLPDQADYQVDATQTVLNVLPRADGYGPFPDYSAYSTALAAACRGYFRAVKTDGSIAVFAATANRLYLMDNTDQSWDDVSKGGSAYSDVSSTDQWQFAQFGNYVIAVQANTVPQVFDLTISSAFADLSGSPPSARYISIVGRFVVLSGLVSTPYRIQWSGLGNVTQWTSGTNSSDYQDLPDGGIVRGVAGGEYGIIFQDNAIRRMTYVPGSPVIFQIERVAEDHGLYAPYSLVRSGNRIFYVSAHGFETMSPTGEPTPIGKERVDRTFLADLDAGSLQLLLGASDPRSNRVFWAYKSNSGTIGLFDKLITLDYSLNRWASIAMTGEFIGSMSQPGVTLEGLDSISGSLDALPASLDSYVTSITPEVAMFNSAHKMGFFRGNNLEATLVSGEQGTDGRRLNIQGFRPITDASSVYGSVSTRETVQATATYTSETLINAVGVCPLRASARYSRGKVRIPAATSWTYAKGIEPIARLEGTR